jgi:hypothetical protein
MTEATIRGWRLDPNEVTAQTKDLVTDIDQITAKARTLRRHLWHEPEQQLTAYALDDMIHLLAQVKLRLPVRQDRPLN